MKDDIVPRVHRTVFGGSTEIICFGMPVDWRPLRNPQAAEVIAQTLLRRHDITELFMVYPAAGQRDYEVNPLRIVSATEIKRQRQIALLSYYKMADRVVVLNHMQADGVIVPPKSAGFIASADCPTAIVNDASGNVIMLHCGREALERPEAMNASARQPANIIEALMQYWNFVFPSKLQIKVVCGIAGNSFPHSPSDRVYGSVNRFRKEYYAKIGWQSCITINDGLDLARLIQLEFAKLKVCPGCVEVDDIDTFSDRNIHTGEFIWNSCRRSHAGYNGILVVNHG